VGTGCVQAQREVGAKTNEIPEMSPTRTWLSKVHAVPHHHQAVHLDARTLIHRVQEAEDRGRIDPLIRWRTARQETRHDASLGHDRTGNRVHPAGVVHRAAERDKAKIAAWQAVTFT
jgi:hypothetical protein